MAQKRMFANSVVMTDNFLDMPSSAKCLYFVLGMNADDDGFITSPKAMMRYCGASQDDYEILINKKYLILFESGVVVLTHWRVNNNVQKDRYKPTMCYEKSLIGIKESGEYYLLPEVAEEEKTESKEQEETSIYSAVDLSSCTENEKTIINEYLKNYESLYNAKIITSKTPIVEWKECIERLQKVIKAYGFDTILLAVKKSLNNQFCIKTGYSLYKILSPSVVSEIVNQPKKEIKESVGKEIENERNKIFKKKYTNCECGGRYIWGDTSYKYLVCEDCHKIYHLPKDISEAMK